MNLKDTVDMMNSSDYKDRLKAEYCQLAIRLNKLTDMLVKMQLGELNFTPKCTRETLENQIMFMEGYKGMLEFRAKLEGVEL